jgi:hypothetical protein
MKLSCVTSQMFSVLDMTSILLMMRSWNSFSKIIISHQKLFVFQLLILRSGKVLSSSMEPLFCILYLSDRSYIKPFSFESVPVDFLYGTNMGNKVSSSIGFS